MTDIQVEPNLDALVRAATEQIAGIAESAIAANGRFTIALSGGNTPQPVYRLLATDEFSRRIDWSRVQVFWGDERCVPPNDEESNYRMAKEALLDHVPLPPANVHRMRGEEDPAQAAAQCGRELQAVFGGDAEGGAPPAGFDLILLGMGDNGHTASLFPGKTAMHEEKRWVVAEYIEAVSMWRITFTPVLINAAATVTFLVAGTQKAEVLHQVLEGPYQPDVLPSQIVKPVHGQLVWLLDQAAASRLTQAAPGR
ncbi:MAG: 6-phosphogluconolactonase [Dehalococcoidia bacterium]